MTTHLSAEQMRNYLVRRVSVNELGTIGEHLHGCRSCSQAYLSVLQTRFPIEIDFDELAGLKGWHLEGEELANYLGGRMNQVDLDYARLHLQECATCEEKVYDSANNWTEHSPSTESAHEENGAPWREYLPAFDSIRSSHWEVAAALLLVIGLALVLWATLHTAPEKAQVSQDVPSETTPSEDLPERATRPPINGGKGSDRPVDGSAQIGVARNSDNRDLVGRTGLDELALIARNLTMPPAIEMLDRTPSIAVRGNQSSIQSFTIVSPFTTLVKNDRPTFRWTELSGATSYTVSVFDAALNLIRTSEPLAETQWLMPEPLEAGVVYTWTVTALKDGQKIIAPAPPARAEFKILGNSEMTDLTRLLSKVRSHAARGVLYAKAGLLDEAEQELQTHLADHANNERVTKLLETVRSWRGRVLSAPLRVG